MSMLVIILIDFIVLFPENDDSVLPTIELNDVVYFEVMSIPVQMTFVDIPMC